MDAKALARQVAADLPLDMVAAGFRDQVLAAVENPMPTSEATRAFGLPEATMIGCFLASSAQVAIQTWQARQDRALLVLALAEGLESRPELASRLDPERQLGIISRIVNAIIPERFGSSPSIKIEKQRTKQEWLIDWTGYDEHARAMTQ